MAFIPGQLVHTNEILVLLGDNWFVDRSAKQAAEIVDRRVKSKLNNSLNEYFSRTFHFLHYLRVQGCKF